MRKSMINENIDFVKTRINRPESVDEAKEKVALVNAEQNSRMHKVANVAMSVTAGLAVEGTVMATTFQVGNAISEGLTGQSLHGIGLTATSMAAITLGVGAGYRTMTAVEDGLKMVDDYRSKKAYEETSVMIQTKHNKKRSVSALLFLILFLLKLKCKILLERWYYQ